MRRVYQAGPTLASPDDDEIVNRGLATLKIHAKEMRALNIVQDTFHGDWNYTEAR